MSYQDKLKQIDELKAAIEQHGALSKELQNKINYKFRLEWNYTSNSMEGNSLTRQETRSVMIGNITVGGKPIKDILEMKGHDEEISSIMKMGKGELNISEKRIRDIHKAIVHEDDPEKARMIGQWKKEQNYLYNYKNERFDFVAPADVPERMHQLINWLNAEKEKIARNTSGKLHPVMLAIQFHLDYVSIHPFHDGNGRTARILTNIILISYGYPPMYIKEHEKNSYYQYLGDIQGYGGQPDLFYDFMCDMLLRSMQIVLDAIEGREIEEIGDLNKKLALLKKRIGQSPSARVDVKYSKDAVEKVIQDSIEPLVNAWEHRLKEFDTFFQSRTVEVLFDVLGIANSNAAEALAELKTHIIPRLDTAQEPRRLDIRCSFDNLVAPTKNININGGNISVTFNDNNYSILYLGAAKKQPITLLYNQVLTKDEIDMIVEAMGNKLYNFIEKEINESI